MSTQLRLPLFSLPEKPVAPRSPHLVGPLCPTCDCMLRPWNQSVLGNCETCYHMGRVPKEYCEAQSTTESLKPNAA
jgi:hypothetical protein